MSFWEFGAQVEGWSKANGGQPASTPPTPEEHDDLIARFG
jgi:hypothetical protein